MRLPCSEMLANCRVVLARDILNRTESMICVYLVINLGRLISGGNRFYLDIGKSSSEYSLGSQVPVVEVKVPFAQDRQPAWSAAEEIKITILSVFRPNLRRS